MEDEPSITAGNGPRPLVRGFPVVLGASVIAVAVIVLVIVLTRDPGLPADIAADYVKMMAGSLAPDRAMSDAEALSRALARAEPSFTPRITPLDPEFRLQGGRAHDVRGRPAAVWFYRDARSEMVLAEAFVGTLAELGTPEHVRRDRPPALHVFYKTTQTLVFWQEGPLVYAAVATLPSERTIGLARRLASGSR
jgi:hypothetical protein